MPQNEFIELSVKRRGTALDATEKARKKDARAPKIFSKKSRETRGLKAKVLNRRRRVEKIKLKKTTRAQQLKSVKTGEKTVDMKTAIPTYLLERGEPNRSKILNNMIKQKRKEKAGKWSVPIPKVQAIGEDQVFKVISSGKRKKKSWKRMVTKVTFVGDAFTRKPPKYERFIRPMGLRLKKAHVTHPDLKTTFYLPIIGVKKNPKSPLYTSLGVITKGTVIEVNVSELGLVTQNGKIIWGKFAQVTNNPENDGCINAVLLV